MVKKRILILGAGLTGLSAAWHLKEKGIDYKLFEKESEVGGLCRSKRIKGFTFDYGGHLLHFRNNYTLNLIKKILKVNIIRHERSSWVYSFGRYIPYPFQANLRFLPAKIAAECLRGFIKADQKFLSEKNINFLSWIKNSFGPGIARHFMLPYNRKFWRVPLDEMTCEWVDGFIPRPTVSQVLEEYFARRQHQLGYNASFWYPATGGINQLPQAFEKQIRSINKNSPVCLIDLEKKELFIEGRNRESFDILISTLPLPDLASKIRPIPKDVSMEFSKLRWNSIFNLNLGVEKNCHTGKHWIYFPGKEANFFRVGFFHNFAPQASPRGRSALYAEVSYCNNKKIRHNEMARKIIRGLRNNGILKKQQEIDVLDVNDIKYGYPIYDENYSSARKKVINFLLNKDIISCGRYGSWRYMSMEDAILDGQSVAESIKP